MNKSPWTPHQIAILKECYPNFRANDLVDVVGHSIRSIYHMARSLGLAKSAEFYASAASGRGNLSGGESTRFKKNQDPWNKGMKGLDIGGKETRFKKGCRLGKANTLYQPIGAERISKDGYLERKVNDDMPLQRRWRAVHILLWEKENGPLAKGYAVVFKDGDRTSLTIENLECISRAELMRRNSVHRLPKELAEIVQLRGALTRQINKRSNEHAEHQ